MCRNIRPLFNFEPPATEQEIRDAALQYVRKISGIRKPSKANELAFEQAVDTISTASEKLIHTLQTDAMPKNREEELQKRRARFARRSN